MTAWDRLLTATHPGQEVEAGADRWLIISRRYETPEGDFTARPDRMTLTVELVRTGSPADPRRAAPGAPRPTPTKET